MRYPTLMAVFHHHAALRAVRRQLTSPVQAERAEAVHVLVNLGDRRGLRRAFHHTDRFVRREAVKGLAQFGVVRPLVKALSDSDKEVAHIAAECLAHMEDGAQVVRALQRCVRSDDWMVRFFGTMGLGRIESEKVRTLLEHLQEHDDHSWVRGAASQALRRRPGSGVSGSMKTDCQGDAGTRECSDRVL